LPLAIGRGREKGKGSQLKEVGVDLSHGTNVGGETRQGNEKKKKNGAKCILYSDYFSTSG